MKRSTLSAIEKGQRPEHPVRVLVADDDSSVASELHHQLSEDGFEVVGSTTNAVQAVDLCKLHEPDMAIVAVELRCEDGVPTAEHLSRIHDVPVICTAAAGNNDSISIANEAVAFGLLVKPVLHEQLRLAIAIGWNRFLDLDQQVTEARALKQRLEDRKVIEQAKWDLVKRLGITEPDAMRKLQRQARNNSQKLADVARSILENAWLYDNARMTG